MKKLLLSFSTAMLMATVGIAQTPNSINYQAAVRNSSGAVLASTLVQVRFTIHDATATGPTLFQETNTVTTTTQGILNTTIGSGTAVTGTMAGINWAAGAKFLEVELNTGSGYTSIGSQQMVSVPYALYAAKSGTPSPWTLSGTDIFNNNTGKVGIGTSTVSPMVYAQINGLGTYGTPGPMYQGTLMVTGASSASSATGLYAEGGWRGVFGRNLGTSSRTNAIGVYGLVDSASGYTGGAYGVYGEATATGPNNYGVYGSARNGASGNYSIYGVSPGSGSSDYAAYFNGKIYAVSASSSIKAFKIDHPLDPENKYLYHSSVESNDMMNLYNGNTTTNASGEATVTLPRYFTALNKDFKYQLTCIGQFAQAIILEEVHDNQFHIKTDKPNVKVSWQIAGVRKDAAANYYRIENETEKTASEKGFYLVPEAYGKGPERSAAWHNSSQNKDAVYPNEPEKVRSEPKNNEKTN